MVAAVDVDQVAAVVHAAVTVPSLHRGTLYVRFTPLIGGCEKKDSFVTEWF